MKSLVIMLAMVISVLTSFDAYARQIIITTECVYLDELTAPSIPKIEVACGIAPGMERYFAKELIQNHLNRAGIKATVLEGVTVKREGEKVSEYTIVEEIRKSYLESYPNVTIDVEQIRMANDIFKQQGQDVKISIDTSKFGSNYVNIDNGVSQHQLYVYIRAYQDGYISTERIKAGEQLEGKVRIDKIDITAMRSLPLASITGLVAAKSMGYNRPITSDLVGSMPNIKKGDSIRIVYNNNSIRLEVAGIAEEDGHTGKPITVRNLTSQTLVTGTYIGNGIVEIK